VAAGCAGVVREAARLENSFAVFACWSLRFSATGPVGWINVSNDQTERQSMHSMNFMDLIHTVGYILGDGMVLDGTCSSRGI
jgi:hypothetical protein